MKYRLLIYASFIFFFLGCEDGKFNDFTELDITAPTNLYYQEITNTREFLKITSKKPTIDSGNLVPVFEIISGRKEDGTLLDDSFMQHVSIESFTIETRDLLSGNSVTKADGTVIDSYSILNDNRNGIITIADDNNFSLGTYFFTVKATTTDGDQTYETIFNDVYKVNVGPELVSDLVYFPASQNLLTAQSSKTTKPFIANGNSAVTFELESHKDTLSIDAQTGIISLNNDYVTVANDTLFPSVNVISTITNEVKQFQGKDFLMLVASNTPVDLPRRTNYFFYPTLESNNTLSGYSVDIIRNDTIASNRIWQQINPTPLTQLDANLPQINGRKAIRTQGYTNEAGGLKISMVHESDVIINSQNLSVYNVGDFDLEAVFYMRNRFAEYSSTDGRALAEIEIYVSTDYTGDNAGATWTRVNDQVECRIGNASNNSLGAPFIGTPYPGNQTGPDPDNRKDSSRNADGRWVKCSFDLNPYKADKRFTLKFKFNTYFSERVEGTFRENRTGHFSVSDIHYIAREL